MAKLKYSIDAIPLVNEHLGYTFQPNHYGQSLFPSSKSARTRYTTQSQRQQNLLKAVRNWRNMSPETKLNWKTFAETYPQASRRNPARFLSGRQLFLKRQHYLFLNFGIESEYMEAPALVELPVPSVTFSVDSTENCIDVTELYISKFGIIPEVGNFLLLKVFPMAIHSGQFFLPIEETIQIQESFIDGLFISLHFADAIPAITFSVYLSKPVYQSTVYGGTKTKYMGCFSPKTFLSLTDTPDSYIDQADKIVSVKPDETGLEFTDPGGGGLDCASLLDCPSIQQIIEQIEANSIAIASAGVVAYPPINFGLIYNSHAIFDSNFLCAVGWHVPSRIEIEDMVTYLGGLSIAGDKLKDTSLAYWTGLSSGTDNSSKFNSRGSGFRHPTTGNWSNWRSANYIWTSTPVSSWGVENYRTFGNLNSVIIKATVLRTGCSIRLFKDSTTLLNGQSGVYVGNNGQIYRTICIGGNEVTADSLVETKFRNGAPIAYVPNNSAWVTLDSAGYCCPNLDCASV